MKEKERYEIVYFDNDTSWKIIDNKTKQEVGGINDMIKLLNQQDKRIRELEKVKEDTKNVHIEDTQYDCYCFQETTRDKCVKIIDKQIEELKKEMK